MRNLTTGAVSGPETAGGATGIAIADISPQPEVTSEKTRKWGRVDVVEIENFKAIQKTSVRLGDVTILVGPNGSGKSSVLQAVHWAARAASYIEPRNTKEVVAFERLDYLPSSDPLRTAFRSSLATSQSTPPTRISFIHSIGIEELRDAAAATSFATGGEKINSDPITAEESKGGKPEAGTPIAPTATIKIWAARNQGGISVHIEGGAAVTPFKQRSQPLTAYIPGLAGLAEKETMLAQPLLRRQAASGDAGGVLRNVLFNLASRQPGEVDNENANRRIGRLNALVQSVHPAVKVQVSYNDREDININATFSDLGLAGDHRPLETAATGVLQVIQIFAYIVYFRPKILLIDEPDAHLHPDKQERLIEALELASQEFDAQIILTTHSPHIVRAASSTARLVWMNAGAVVDGESELIRRLMGWGALDKKLIFFVEDEDDKPIRALLRQWPSLYRQLSLCPCLGVENLPKDKLLVGLAQGGGVLMKAIVHRDRDFMTDEECEKWRRSYTDKSTFAWVTGGVDVESYFCQSTYLQKLYGVSADVAEAWRVEAAVSVSKAKEKFYSKRDELNRMIYREGGGSPATDLLWNAAGGVSPDTVLGKKMLAALKPIVTKAKKDQDLLNNFVIPEGFELAADLRTILESALTR